MRKIYSLFLLAAIVALPTTMTNAQQLPNASFEDGWTDCVPWTSDGKTVKCGETPSYWTIAHVSGMGASGTGKTTVGEKAEGRTGNNAIQIKNSPNSMVSSQTVPGYFSLGKSWNTAVSVNMANTKDGGTFGGYENFTYRPDAVEFYYKRSHGTANASEKATILAYLWKGSTSQTSVPGNIIMFGNPTKATMTDRDRNILDMTTSQGGNVTKSSDFERIAKFQYDIDGDAADWTRLEIPLTYESTATPSKINVLFSAGDYFSTNPGVENSLTVDDVKLIYFSRLASLSIDGTPLENFDSNTYAYNVDTEMPEESAFAFTTLGNSGSAKATVALDAANAVATITVTNSNAGGEDVDGETSHVYSIQFKKSGSEKSEEVYSGSITIDMGTGDLTEGNGKGDVHIIDNGDGTYDFLLPDFTLPMGDESYNLGDINVEGLTKSTAANGSSTYNGSKQGLTLSLGETPIVANVIVNGTVDANGKAFMTIAVTWLSEDMGDIPIAVVFNGEKKDPAGIDDVTTDLNDANAPAEYYNLQGVRVAADNLTPGIYVVRQGKKVSKVYVR